MSISNFKYPDRLYWLDIYRIKNFSGIVYKKDGDTKISNPAGIGFSLPPNASSATDPATQLTIFTYSDGIKFVIEYRLYVVEDSAGFTYYMDRCYGLLLDIDDSIITQASLIGGTRRYIPLTDPIEPFSIMYFVPGLVTYSTNNPTITGEEATRVYLSCVWEQNHQQVLPVPFTEIANYNTYIYTWYLWGFGVCDTQELYDTRIKWWTEHGDRTDPSGSGEDEGGDDYDPSGPGGSDVPIYGPSDGDSIDFPGLPTVSAFQTGLVTAYKMSLVQLNALAGELWSNTFFDSISKILNDPFDALIGLSLIPLTISGTDSVIKIGNYTATTHGDRLSNQFITVDAGYFTVPLAWHNFLDFTKTQLSLYLPFVGLKRLDPDDVMGKTIYVKYNVDILTGGAICFVKCDNSVLYTYPCNIGYDIPLTGSNKAALYTGLINTAMSAASGAVMGGASGAIMGAAKGAISTATSKQSDVNRSGGLSGSVGLLCDFDVYIIIHRPTQSLPASFKDIKGYTSNITKTLSLCKGFTKVDTVHLAIEGATDQELDEIKQLLQEGVII